MHMIPMALAIGGGLIKAGSQMNAGSQSRAALYGQAQETEATGAAQELRVREQALQEIGRQRAAQSGNGFIGDSGSAADALAQSYASMALDVLQLRRDAALRAKAMRAEGDQAYAEGRAGAAATLIGTAGSVIQMKGDWAAARQMYGPSPSSGAARKPMTAGADRYGTRRAAGKAAAPMTWGGGI